MQKYLKPAPGHRVPDPERGGTLQEHGRRVELSQYWLRRIADGSVIESEPPADDEASTEAQASDPAADQADASAAGRAGSSEE